MICAESQRDSQIEPIIFSRPASSALASRFNLPGKQLPPSPFSRNSMRTGYIGRPTILLRRVVRVLVGTVVARRPWNSESSSNPGRRALADFVASVVLFFFSTTLMPMLRTAGPARPHLFGGDLLLRERFVQLHPMVTEPALACRARSIFFHTPARTVHQRPHRARHHDLRYHALLKLHSCQ